MVFFTLRKKRLRGFAEQAGSGLSYRQARCEKGRARTGTGLDSHIDNKYRTH
jgi:hypothetical protein